MKIQSGQTENAPNDGDDQGLDTRFEDAGGRNWVMVMIESALMRLHWREARRVLVNVIKTHGDERYELRCAYRHR